MNQGVTHCHAYYYAAARAAGVPDLWLKDAAQDIALACWLADDDGPIVVSRRAIDAARKYGYHRRNRTIRDTVELALYMSAGGDPFDEVNIMIDFRAWYRLTRRQRSIIVEALAGKSSVSGQRLYHVRMRLRKLAA